MRFGRTIQSVLITLICTARSVATNDANSFSVIDESRVAHAVSRDDATKLPRHKIKAKDHDRESEFEGVLLVDLLKSVGVEFGDRLKGPRASNVIVLEAMDG